MKLLEVKCECSHNEPIKYVKHHVYHSYDNTWMKQCSRCYVATPLICQECDELLVPVGEPLTLEKKGWRISFMCPKHLNEIDTFSSIKPTIFKDWIRKRSNP